jgi:chromosome segregation ATPase
MEDELKDFKIDIQFFAEEGQKPTEEEVDTDNEEVDPLEGLDEATKETINGLQDALDEANNKVTDLENKLQESTTKQEDLFNKIVEFAKSLGIAKEEGPESEAVTEEVNKLKDEKAQLEATVESLTVENNGLLAQVAEFKSKEVTSVAEQIATLKVELGDIKEEEKQALLDKLATRTKESLQDSLDDLIARKPATESATVITVPKVTSPAQADNTGNGVVEAENPESVEEAAAKAEIKITPQEAFRGLLTGKKVIPNKKQGGNN